MKAYFPHGGGLCIDRPLACKALPILTVNQQILAAIKFGVSEIKSDLASPHLVTVLLVLEIPHVLQL